VLLSAYKAIVYLASWSSNTAAAIAVSVVSYTAVTTLLMYMSNAIQSARAKPQLHVLFVFSCMVTHIALSQQRPLPAEIPRSLARAQQQQQQLQHEVQVARGSDDRGSVSSGT
jgi:hypothetical protein